MEDYYAQRAREYERIYAKPERQGDLQQLRESIMECLAGRDVLEVACGTGYWTEVIARSARSVLALDLNEEVLELARMKSIPKEQVTFAQADAYALPELPQPFDACFAGFWWSHIPKARLRSFLLGLHEALTPDAKVMFIDNRYVEGSSTPISRRDDDGNTYQNRVIEDGRAYEVLKNFPAEEELRETLQGLADKVQIEFLPYYWKLIYVPQVDG